MSFVAGLFVGLIIMLIPYHRQGQTLHSLERTVDEAIVKLSDEDVGGVRHE